MYTRTYAAGFISPVRICRFELLVLGSLYQRGERGNSRTQWICY